MPAGIVVPVTNYNTLSSTRNNNASNMIKNIKDSQMTLFTITDSSFPINWYLSEKVTQLTFTCSKSMIDTLEKSVKNAKVNN